jgi:hypothetical protein
MKLRPQEPPRKPPMVRAQELAKAMHMALGPAYVTHGELYNVAANAALQVIQKQFAVPRVTMLALGCMMLKHYAETVETESTEMREVIHNAVSFAALCQLETLCDLQTVTNPKKAV